MNPGQRNRRKLPKARHYFFLNPYTDSAFTRCPKCETHTKVRKHCLVIHIKPHHLIVLNKTTRYCPYCDLIIAKKEELEQNLCAICETHFPEIIGNDYLVFGTVGREVWKKSKLGIMSTGGAIDCIHIFKNVWSFEVEPMGWASDEERTGKNPP